MKTVKALDRKPYVEYPHVRFDEEEVASAATPRRGSLLYKKLMKTPGRWLAFALMLLPMAVHGDGFLDDDLSYGFEYDSDTEVYVSGLRNSSATHITIPKTVSYEYHDYNDKDDDGNPSLKRRTCKVKRIANSAFSDKYSLKSVTIRSGLTSIGDSAFYGCTNLTSIAIPDSVTSIGNAAFSNCIGLKSVTIPKSVKSIGDGAFYGCRNLVSVLMPHIKYDSSVFEDCHPNLKISYWDAPASYKLVLKSNNKKYGTVSGGGMHEAGAKVTIKAKAKSGYVFVGWFTDKSCKKALNPKGYDNRKPTVKVVMPSKNKTIYAKFVTKAADKKALKFSAATKKLAKTPAMTAAGEAFSLGLGFSSASLPTVTAKGLPKGLSIDKTTGKISGKTTVSGDFTVTVTVKDAAGNSIVQKVKITVLAPSWATGTFYGTARPGAKSSDPTAYLTFTVAAAGKVSGKVMYNNKAYSFSAANKSCTATKMTFAPKVKIGLSYFKPGTVTVRQNNVGGISLVEASAVKNGAFIAQKKPGLITRGWTLGALVGKTFTFTRNSVNSGLTKSNDKLTVKLGSGDAVTVSGRVNGKKVTALSWVVLFSDRETAGGISTYTLYVDIVLPKQKYERTLVITATAGSGGTKATAEFAK